jgi:hypothetical protein
MSFCRMWRKFRRVVLVGVVLTNLFALFAIPAFPVRVAYAQDTADEAEKQFQNGVERYKQGDYRAALEFFLASNRLAPNKNVLPRTSSSTLRAATSSSISFPRPTATTRSCSSRRPSQQHVSVCVTFSRASLRRSLFYR